MSTAKLAALDRLQKRGYGVRRYPRTNKFAPRTRAERAGTLETAVDPDTGKEYVTARSRSGRLLDKNRSDDWRGYKSHLTRKQKLLIAYALRQLDRGCHREAVWVKIQPYWNPSPMQYPLTAGTIQSWLMIRGAQRARGREWPDLSS